MFKRFKWICAEIICTLIGHRWTTSTESIADGIKIKRKIYCSRCGRLFKSHAYRVCNKTYNSNKVEI